jgi:hypothetical protein
MTTSQAAHVHWKSKIDDLRDLAASVMDTPAAAERLSARTCARCLMGVVSLISRRWTVDDMQRTCAELVRFDDAWTTSFGRVPLERNGMPSEQTQLLVVVARALLPLAGADHVRAALSFWATESDPGVWTSLGVTE